MDLTKEVIRKLTQAKEAFNVRVLSKKQVEFILGKDLSDKARQAYVTSENRKPKKTKSQVKRLLKESKEKSKPKFTLRDVAKYLSEYCKLTTGRSHLRSANACLLSVPRTRTTYDDRSFAVSGLQSRGTVYPWHCVQVTSLRRLSEDI